MVRYLTLLMALASCRSIEGHYVGSPETGDDVGGLPIVVERTRWLKATHKEVTYAFLDSAAKEARPDKRVKEISVEPVKAEEVYAIDVKRPMAGTIDYDLQFPDGKAYPKQVKGRVEDKTVEQMTTLVEKLLQQLGPPRAAGVQPPPPPPSGITVMRMGESITKIEFYDIEQLLEGGPVTPVLTIQ